MRWTSSCQPSKSTVFPLRKQPPQVDSFQCSPHVKAIIVSCYFLFLDSGSTCKMNNFEPVCNSYNTKGYLTITQANWTHGCAWNYNTVDMWHDVTSLLQGYCGNHYDCVEMINDSNILPCSTDYYHYSYHNFSDTFMCKQTGWQTCERTNTSDLNHRFMSYCGIVYWDYNCTSK